MFKKKECSLIYKKKKKKVTKGSGSVWAGKMAQVVLTLSLDIPSALIKKPGVFLKSRC